MSFRFTVKQNPLEIEFEAGSIKEGLAILSTEETELGRFFQTAASLAAIAAANGGGNAAVTETTSAGAEGNAPPAGGRRPGRPPKNANAPAPTPTPGAPPAPPAPPPLNAAPPAAPAAPVGAVNPQGEPIPGFLQRTDAPAPPAPPAPPPPAPPAPPAAPANDLTLAPKVVENLKARAAGTADKGAALADWLAKSGVIAAGATFDEALAVVQFTRDAQLAPIATALGVS
jgi:hypothetical protein